MLNCLSQGRSLLLQGLGAGRCFHCIQSGFGSSMVVSGRGGTRQAVPVAPLPCILAARSSSPWDFAPIFCQNLRWVPRGDVEQDRAAQGAGWFSCLAGCCASPAPSSPKKMMLSYPPLLPLPAGWRCLSTTLFPVLAPAEGQHQNPPLEGQKPSEIQAKQMLPAALPEYLTLRWPKPSTGKAAVRCCEQVPKLSVLWSRPQLVASWILPQHRSPGMALSSPPAPLPCSPCVQPGRMASSHQRWEEGLNNCRLSVCLLSVQKRARCSLLVISRRRVIHWGTVLLKN